MPVRGRFNPKRRRFNLAVLEIDKKKLLIIFQINTDLIFVTKKNNRIYRLSL